MREIKFRAWDKKEQIWTVPFTLGDIIEGFITKEQFDECDVVQFTGLKDKNGKEIYEGDVLSLESYRDDVLCHWEVCFEQGTFCGKQTAGGIDYLRNMSEHEAIGNIYENPELLEKPEPAPANDDDNDYNDMSGATPGDR